MKKRSYTKEFAHWANANPNATTEEKFVKLATIKAEVDAHNAIWQTTPEGIAEQQEWERKKAETLAFRQSQEALRIQTLAEMATDETSRQWIAPLVLSGLI